MLLFLFFDLILLYIITEIFPLEINRFFLYIIGVEKNYEIEYLKGF